MIQGQPEILKQQMIDGVEDLEYLADFAESRSLRPYRVDQWILVTPVSPEVTLGLVAGLISSPNEGGLSREEIERRGPIFLRLIESQTVRVFPTLSALEAAAGTDSFRVIYLGNAYVLEPYR